MKKENLKIGLKVQCPEDRGNKAYYGKIIGFSNDINYNINKSAYVWVSVEDLFGRTSIWSSNRLIDKF